MLSLTTSRRPKKTASKRRYAVGPTRRPWQRFDPMRGLFQSSNPFSDSFVHKFRRLGLRAVLSGNGSSAPTIYEDAGLIPAFTLGVQSNEPVPPGLGNCLSFGATYTAQLCSAYNYADLTALFNEYRIDKVEMSISLLNGPSGRVETGGLMPSVYVRYDPNDATMPTNFADLAQAANTKEFVFSEKTTHLYNFVPKASLQAYALGGGAGVGFAAPANSAVWYDTSGPSAQIPMYGLKFWFRNFVGTAGYAPCIAFQPVFYLSLRRPR